MEEQSNFIIDIYSLMKQRNVILSYLGDITPDVTNNLLQLLKKNSMFDDETGVKKKVYKIMVECLENITRHSNIIERAIPPAIFLLLRSETHYHIVTGNYIFNKNVPQIKEMLDSINQLSREEIKKRHLTMLAESQISEKGGAGIGIIDIALKSGHKLEYTIIPSYEDISFYVLDAKVSIQ